MLKRILLTLAMGILICGAAQGAEPRFEITPFFTHRNGGGFQDAAGQEFNLLGKSGAAGAISWAASASDAQYELLFSKQSTLTDSTSPSAMRIEYLQLGGTTLLGDATAHVVPFAAGGIGAARFTPSIAGLTQETRWAFSLGGGVRIPIVKHVRLRIEARGYLTWLNGSSSLFCSSTSTSTTPCAIRAKGQTLFQYDVLGGVSFGF